MDAFGLAEGIRVIAVDPDLAHAQRVLGAAALNVGGVEVAHTVVLMRRHEPLELGRDKLRADLLGITRTDQRGIAFGRVLDGLLVRALR